ncbi:MAG: putative Ig domain-containing protein [Bacteroidales bacterium]|nr:putative Ig domain-containing protein [Bacteroidales bacterium]
MKKILIPLLFSFLAFILDSAFAQKQINLNLPWKFIQGDNPVYASPGYDDSAWKTIAVDKIWESQGYDPYDGYAWFRVKVVIPSALKSNASLKDSLRIYLGKINNYDQAFLNGQLFGINGNNATPEMAKDSAFIQAPMNFWDKKRPYTLAVNDPRIHWDQENAIAVRVFDQGGQGGMYTGDQSIMMTCLGDYLAIENNLAPYVFSQGKLQKVVGLKNNSVFYHLNGIFRMIAVNKLTGQTVFTKDEKVNLDPGERKESTVELKQIDQSVLITYRFEFQDTGETVSVSDETPYITTPTPPDKPRINGPSVTAARPGKPFLYAVPATGLRPMAFEAINLPEGLILDKQTGIISGKVSIKGNYQVTLKAKNSKGEFTRELTISIGDRICLTPPMGWNSWNCWGLAVDEQKVISSARTYREKGLANHGWTYVNIDDGWEIPGDKNPKRDTAGNILTNDKFPDMKRLGDSIHKFGLKFGIYSSPGPLTCGGYTASYQHEIQDAHSFASWGIDYLKYDWCSYEQIAKDTSLAERKKPYFAMRGALNTIDRDIVYSLCQYGMSKVWQWGDEVGGNLWRTTEDITDTWESLREIGFSQVGNAPFAKPGNWNDPDMLIVGWVGWGPSLHPTRLTPDEQYTHISLWCMLSAPLLIGCDLERLDAFTLNLLANDEVIALDQDPLGKQAVPVIKEGDIQVWVKDLSDGAKAVGIFNLGKNTVKYSLDLEKAGIKPGGQVRDLWRQKTLETTGKILVTDIPSHGVSLLKIKQR